MFDCIICKYKYIYTYYDYIYIYPCCKHNDLASSAFLPRSTPGVPVGCQVYLRAVDVYHDVRSALYPKHLSAINP